MNKIKNSYVKLALWMLVGLIFGVLIIIVTESLNIKLLKEFGTIAYGIMNENKLTIQLIILVFSFVFIFFNYNKAKVYVNEIDLETIDEEQYDSIEDTLEKIQGNIIITNNLVFILSFVVFLTLSTYNVNEVIFSGLIFIITVLLTTISDLKVINQIKKLNPMKKGDPTDLSFAKDWINSCDEAERQQIYKVSYETMKVMSYVFLGFFIVLMITKFELGTGNFPIVIVGFLWSTMTICTKYFSNKNRKKGLQRGVING